MLKFQYFGHLMQRADSLEKTLVLGKIEGRKGVTENEMAGRHHQINGHEFEQTPGDGKGQGSLACCSPWNCRVRHDLTTEQQNRREGAGRKAGVTGVFSEASTKRVQRTERGSVVKKKKKKSL